MKDFDFDMTASFVYYKPYEEPPDSCTHIDVRLLSNYIWKEMRTNIKSQETKQIKDKLDSIGSRSFWDNLHRAINPIKNIKDSVEDIIAFVSAAILWKDLVKAKAKWDHKPKIDETFGRWSCNKEEDLPLKFYFDLWSNIHYGYVGRYVGFSEWTLLNGAGVAQIGDNNKDLTSLETWKEYLKNRGVDWFDGDIFGGFDDASDQQAIKIGCRLYDQYKAAISPRRILDEIDKTYESGKPISIEKCEQHL